MSHLSYSFCMSMLHSLWQAGLLLLAYILSEKIFQHKTSPLQKRNWLFILLVAQLSFFVITFLIYFLNIENTVTENLLGNTVTGILSADSITLFTPWLFALYLVAISYKMIKALYEWLHFKKLHLSGLQKPSIDLKLFTIAKADHFGIKRKVQLWFSNTINTPVTFGFFKPIIVLPVALINQLSIKQAETLILHELTHIKANDFLLNWALIIIENIFFFNPFIITLCTKLRLEREKYCDSNVIAFAYSPILYAETLLQVQQVQQFIPQYQLAAVTGKKQLLQRIQFFTNKKNFTSRKKNSLIFPLLSFLLLTVFIATFFFQYQLTAVAKPVLVNAIAPLNNNNVSDEVTPSFVSNIIENLNDENLQKIEAAVEKQKPMIEKQLKKLQPLIKSVQEKAEVFAQQFDNMNVTPVAFRDSVPTRQIIVKEEQSGSKNAVVKVYTVSFINGQWVIVPDWILSAKEIPTDSLLLPVTADSAVINGAHDE
ncbi:M56 family metallopeptidase [Ferruginibacter sp. SUN106]|uniref:M56 family metallopeptidase n=1 Tax=Ferruginibacter sp. SUN106 TaxID=2978348 RepID=UPI003D3651F5